MIVGIVTEAVAEFCAGPPVLDPLDYSGVDATGLNVLSQWAWDFTNSIFVQIGWKEELLSSKSGFMVEVGYLGREGSGDLPFCGQDL